MEGLYSDERCPQCGGLGVIRNEDAYYEDDDLTSDEVDLVHIQVDECECENCGNLWSHEYEVEQLSSC